jgi:fatty-acyl-CoA synthase
MRIDENSVAELFYTSGVSAHPKGVMLTHRNVYLHAVNAALAFNMTAVDAHLHAIPLFHANSWGAAHVITLMGGKHVMLPSFEPSDALRLMARERVRSCLLDPEMAIALLRAPERHECELSSLKWVAIGGAPSSPTLVREVRERLGCDCFCGYGLTETSPIVAISRRRPGVNWKGEQHYERQAMAGYAIPGVEVRILDENGADAPRDGRTVGEIVVRGDGVMRGYWRQQEAGARALRDGWFHTGDLATIDAHGYISVVDRKEDVIGAGEERISSVKLEETLRAHPCVLEAAVISDETAGRAAKAFVALKPGRRVSEDDILAFCRARLPDHRALQAVEFVSELPKTANGKTPKWKLRGNRVRKRLEHALAAPDLT